jgi:hypothetical protein
VLSKTVKNNPRIGIVELTALFSVILLVPQMLLGAYRLSMYYLLPRLMLWGYSSKRYIAGSAGHSLLRKVLIIIAVVFYALFMMSRRSANPGFKFSFVDLLK